MQDRSDAVQVGCRTGQSSQYMSEAGKDICRTGRKQCRTDVGQYRCSQDICRA